MQFYRVNAVGTFRWSKSGLLVKRMCICWSANYLSDQLMLWVLLNPLYVQLCLQLMYVLTKPPEYIGSTSSADDSVVP
jgi:hypothetical protein